MVCWLQEDRSSSVDDNSGSRHQAGAAGGADDGEGAVALPTAKAVSWKTLSPRMTSTSTRSPIDR